MKNLILIAICTLSFACKTHVEEKPLPEKKDHQYLHVTSDELVDLSADKELLRDAVDASQLKENVSLVIVKSGKVFPLVEELENCIIIQTEADGVYGPRTALIDYECGFLVAKDTSVINKIKISHDKLIDNPKNDSIWKAEITKIQIYLGVYN